LRLGLRLFDFADAVAVAVRVAVRVAVGVAVRVDRLLAFAGGLGGAATFLAAPLTGPA